MKIISGGQVGVDIAGLRAAQSLGFETGGWMPRGFLTKDGPRPEYAQLYGLVETNSDKYPTRTYMNVHDSDGTLRIAKQWQSRGEICTRNAIKKYDKPCFDLDYEAVVGMERSAARATAIVNWLIDHKITTLNIAGNAVVSMEVPVLAFIRYTFLTHWKRLP